MKLSLSEIFDRLGSEITQIHKNIDQVEQTILGLLEDHEIQLEENVVEKLQFIDLLSQSSAALAAYTNGVSQAINVSEQIDTTAALSSVPLNDMRCRLASCSSPLSTKALPEKGKAEMFI
ncbi:hypothetical protein [Algirhabdus cladophorae]|uniref:hypothetical protein n=1 Tax=Algirhabdus cladophorae TaxID=3377108 RepID=UPI003B84AB2D